ncbi:hypothetical protein DSUL_60062 [Desulfovibrionales bacterium]
MLFQICYLVDCSLIVAEAKYDRQDNRNPDVALGKTWIFG